jgi:RNA polymerase subunit RPABC4/transcription elongation factor Spt4
VSGVSDRYVKTTKNVWFTVNGKTEEGSPENVSIFSARIPEVRACSENHVEDFTSPHFNVCIITNTQKSSTNNRYFLKFNVM